MKFFKGATVFAIAFAAAWVIIFTFIQTPFQQTVPAKLLWYQTPPYPIYYYLIGSFVLGLLIGLGAAGYSYLATAMQLRKQKRETREQRERAEGLERQLEGVASQPTPEFQSRDEAPTSPESSAAVEQPPQIEDSDAESGGSYQPDDRPQS